MSIMNSGGSASVRHVRRGVLALGILLAWVSPCFAQMSPEKHASHHPGQDKGKAKETGGAEPKNGMGGGMGGMAKGGEDAKKASGGMGDMGKMMEGMGAPPPKELYPSLMELPDLTPEKRDEVARQAGDRMATGVARLSEAVDRLSQATLDDDYAAMQAATAQMREGLAEFESGLAARRALAEGSAPRSVALHWFKREMDLHAPADAEESRKAAGPSWFHLFSMALLIGFAMAMLAMYFFKMRRAAALFGRIEAGKGSPPPGSAPPLAGGPGPAAAGAPPKGKAPPPEGMSPSAPTPPALTPTAEKSPASGPPAGDPPPPVATPAAVTNA